ncbi:uncharacterized protein LOC135922385 [Gordionus sp. m RMFG-2023]|uniref:uncharacterized protein LOC135922385 n=1 Tax=Gordionus sp. m RMFG-2023 TaxID=3053472 RepID=UPI0031FCF99C
MSDVKSIDINKEELINSVRFYPCLYDKRSIGYKNTQKNNSIWKSIAAENSIETEEIAKSTWKNLRDSFLREHKKLKCLKKSGKQYTNLKKIKPLIPNIGEANIARAMFEQMSGNFQYEDAVEIECVETSQSQSTDVRNDASPSTSESYVPGKKLIKKRDIDQDLFEQVLEIEGIKESRKSTNSWINVMLEQTLAKRSDSGKKKLIKIICDILLNFDSDVE